MCIFTKKFYQNTSILYYEITSRKENRWSFYSRKLKWFGMLFQLAELPCVYIYCCLLYYPYFNVRDVKINFTFFGGVKVLHRYDLVGFKFEMIPDIHVFGQYRIFKYMLGIGVLQNCPLGWKWTLDPIIWSYPNWKFYI